MLTAVQTSSTNAFGAFAQWAALTPAAPALAWQGDTVTYAELHAMACAAAARLEEAGIARGGRVAVRGRKSPETIALVLACGLTGRPALLPAPELRPDVLAEVLADANVEHVVGAQPGADQQAARVGGEHVDPRDAALMLTTSGSTGRPKVVPLSHGAISRFARWASAEFGIAEGTVVLSYCGLNFDLSLLEVWTTLVNGGCAVLVPDDRATQGEHLLDLIAGERVEVLQGVPMLYGLLLEAAGTDGATLTAVEHAILTGDAVPVRRLAPLAGLLPNAQLHNVYGCTETNDSFRHPIDPGRAVAQGAVPLGEPLPGVSALVVDGGAVLDGPCIGELWVSTPFQTSGYLGAPERNRAFHADPQRASERIYFRSGDLVRRNASGELFLEGRTDHQVKIRGNRVNLQAVEEVFAEHPDVIEAAVVALHDDLGGRRLHAAVQRRAGSGLGALSLRSHCARRLTRFAMPPSIQIQDEPLPRTPTGKVDRGAVECHATGRTDG